MKESSVLPQSEVAVIRIPYCAGRGPCLPRNEAILGSSAPWIFLLDSDAEPRPDCLGLLLQALQAEPDAALVVPRVLGRDGQSIHYDGGLFHFLGEMCFDNYRRPLARAAAPNPRPTVASATALLIRRDAALRAGLFDERLVFFREDLDFSLRMRACGYKIIHVPQAVVSHARHAPGPGSLHERRTFYQTRNRWLILLRLFSRRSLILTFPLQLLYEALNLGLSLRRGELRQYCAAWVSVLRELPRTLRERRDFQSRKVLDDAELLSAPPLSWRPQTLGAPASARVKGALDRLCRFWWAMISRRPPRT